MCKKATQNYELNLQEISSVLELLIKKYFERKTHHIHRT